MKTDRPFSGRSVLCTGMGLVVYVLQLLIDDLRIYLGGGDVRMSQHFLDRGQIGAVLQKMGGKGMPQSVGGDLLLDPG